MNNSLKILKDNSDCVKGSFTYFLHEKDTFNNIAFWDYYNSIIIINKNTKGKTFDKSIFSMMFHTYTYILKSFIWHLSSDCYDNIKNYPSDKITLYIERLEHAVGGYYKDYVIDEDKFDEDLKNPKYK